MQQVIGVRRSDRNKQRFDPRTRGASVQAKSCFLNSMGERTSAALQRASLSPEQLGLQGGEGPKRTLAPPVVRLPYQNRPQVGVVYVSGCGWKQEQDILRRASNQREATGKKTKALALFGTNKGCPLPLMSIRTCRDGD